MLNIAEYFWVYKFVKYLFNFYEYSMLAYILTSWFPQIKNNFIVEFLEAICEPYLKIFRKIIPPFGMLDISPIAALVVLSVIENLIIMLLFKLS
ncbi:MAG: YggT family protein [Gemella haemolysans]|uniref:YggT family protein n=1 Tax=Gemella haemolysans TaxID=1379 RepID=UPI002635C4DA|nr:YggT family protein [Gemella haemolysans]MBS5318773.1 YggT family protein [Gemella haemolysans]MDU3831516.1 YggT family protein [Gemella haemolysans]MDU6767577.1 YggT family protein [Gemella haemolysans]